ncbi:MAG: MarR family transcriptional regulator [Rhizobiales bacterium NRL2]|jgi:DNA-binding MarR family transcriptional regulator|nr:MAG: MarR family transcriptional regulator [Rhizobiales bacterium NRL2]
MSETMALADDYRLDDQVGFRLRQATQRHTAIFAERMVAGLTPTQFAAMAKLRELGPASQNLLGRRTAMDAATIKGVIDRLRERGFAETRRDPADGRRLLVALTPEGQRVAAEAIAAGRIITEETLGPLNAAEQRRLLDLLAKLG